MFIRIRIKNMSKYNTYPNCDKSYDLKPIYKGLGPVPVPEPELIETSEDKSFLEDKPFLESDQNGMYINSSEEHIETHSCLQRNKHISIPITTFIVGLVIGMAVAGLAPNVYVLGAARIFTGIGIGGLLAASAATSSDYCNDKYRSLAVVLVAGGFAFGIYLGATFLAPLLKQYDWRIAFYLGSFLGAVYGFQY